MEDEGVRPTEQFLQQNAQLYAGGEDPLIMMESIVDILHMLDYENKFCKIKGFKPIAHSFFALPAANASEQFIYFVSLVSWLLSVNNHQVSGWNKYDDPMAASQNVLIECKKLGLLLNVAPAKLKAGNGEDVCTVLLKLCEASIQSKFKFKKPVIREEGALDDEADDVGDDMEGRADLADGVHREDEDEEIDEDMDIAGYGGGIQADLARQMEQEKQQSAIIYSGITKEKWLIEVERVSHKLKINKTTNDGKEWRSHLDQTKKYADSVRGALPEVKTKLERLQDDAYKALEKISKKEGLLSRSFQGQTGDYRAHSESLKEVQSSFTTLSKNVEDLENELSEVNSRLETTSKKIDDTGKTFSDNTPLQNMKKSITNVKSEIKSIEIRIGVVSNTLLQLKLRERTKVIEDGQMEIVDNEYEVET